MLVGLTRRSAETYKTSDLKPICCCLLHNWSSLKVFTQLRLLLQCCTFVKQLTVHETLYTIGRIPFQMFRNWHWIKLNCEFLVNKPVFVLCSTLMLVCGSTLEVKMFPLDGCGQCAWYRAYFNISTCPTTQ